MSKSCGTKISSSSSGTGGRVVVSVLSVSAGGAGVCAGVVSGVGSGVGVGFGAGVRTSVGVGAMVDGVADTDVGVGSMPSIFCRLLETTLKPFWSAMYSTRLMNPEV